MKPVVLAILVLGLAACKEDIATIAPVEMTNEALGHYCQMFVADHPGPKAQVHLKGHSAPLWFSQVSDAVAYMHDPERDAEVMGVFVSDMSRAESWALPGLDNWLASGSAAFVIESDRLGGMGVPEAIPFGSTDAAAAFVADHGGRVVAWDAVPETYVRPDMAQMSGHPAHAGAGQ